MHLKTTCPRCNTTYQVDPSLRGKQMRCPGRECRFVFEVREGAATPPQPTPAPPAPAASARHLTGSVGDFIPILHAEQADAPPAPTPAAPPVQAVPVLPAELAAPPEPPEPVGPFVNPPPPPVRARGVPPPSAEPRKPAPRARPPQPPQAPPPPRTRGAAPPPPAPVEPAPVRTLGRPAALPAPPQAPVVPPAPAAPPAPEALSDDDAQELLRELGLVDVAGDSPPVDGPAPPEPDSSAAAVADWRAGPPPRADATSPGPELAGAVLSPPAAEHAPAPRKRRRSLVAVVLLLALLGGGAWGVWHLVAQREAGNEADRSQRALRRYQERNYAEAAEQFRTLARDFPKSRDEAKYRFLAELADVLDPLQGTQVDVKELERNADRLLRFLEEQKTEPLLAEHHPELHDSFRRLGREFLAQADQKLDRSLLQTAAGLYEVATKYKAGAADVAPELARVERRIAARELQENTVAAVKKRLDGGPSAAAVKEAQEIAAHAGLEKTPEVKALLDRLPEAHRATVTYTAVPPAAGRDEWVEDGPPGLLVTPALEAHRTRTRAGRRPVLAVARGVLYALEPDNGRVRWAVRVGADTGTPPLWLPRDDIAPDQVLVLSSDSQALAALDAATGATRWCRRLSAPCLGAPVLIDGRAFVPTYDGRVAEIDVSDGVLVGFYDLGQPLSAGAALQPGTHLLYVPADSFCVYVLDVGKQTCAAVLYSGHPSGSLRTPPLVIARGKSAGADAKPAGPDGYLVLSQAAGLEGVRLRVFALPVAAADADPVQQEGPLEGSVWFPAWSDGEQLAVVTDAGEFLLYRVEARADRSAPLALIGRERFALAGRGQAHPARAQLIHADGETFWALAHGGLFRVRHTFTRAAGPHLNPPGHEVARPGSPLHAAYVEAGEAGETFYLTTQSADGLASLAMAFDAARGEVRWQRQLGVVCRGQPVAVGGRVLARDVTGGLFLFDPGKVRGAPGDGWRLGGERVSSRAPGDGGSFHLVTAANGTVYALEAHRRGAGHVLTMRAFATGKDPEPPREFTLPAPLAGTPAVVGDALILPLGSGVLARQPLAGGGALTGPNWRAEYADEQAQGHVVAIGPDDFLVTDGSRGLKRMHTDGKVWETRAPAAELPNRIVAPPAVLPALPGSEPRACVADSANTVTLLEGDGLRAVRRWTLSGRVTVGPFVRGSGIGCVVEDRRLVWLDPERPQPVWPPYEFQADVVGLPQLVDGVLVAADERGHVHAIDPATGQLAGAGYSVRASAAPTAAPVPFGPDRLFVPLTDGTVLLPSRRCLQHPLQGFPLLR